MNLLDGVRRLVARVTMIVVDDGESLDKDDYPHETLSEIQVKDDDLVALENQRKKWQELYGNLLEDGEPVQECCRCLVLVLLVG